MTRSDAKARFNIESLHAHPIVVLRSRLKSAARMNSTHLIAPSFMFFADSALELDAAPRVHALAEFHPNLVLPPLRLCGARTLTI
jgi:hypothetical protein